MFFTIGFVEIVINMLKAISFLNYLLYVDVFMKVIVKQNICFKLKTTYELPITEDSMRTHHWENLTGVYH